MSLENSRMVYYNQRSASFHDQEMREMGTRWPELEPEILALQIDSHRKAYEGHISALVSLGAVEMIPVEAEAAAPEAVAAARVPELALPQLAIAV